MTKKLKCLIFLPLLFSSFVSCSSSSKGVLTFGRINSLTGKEKSLDHFDVLGYADLEKKITSSSFKESFLLVTVKKGSGCTCFNEFASQIQEYNKRYNGLFYLIYNSEFSDGKSTFGLTIPNDDTVTFSIFDKGQLSIQYIRGGKNDHPLFQNFTALRQEISNRLSDPRMYYLDQTSLDDKLSKSDQFNLYIKKSGCPDCEDAEPTTIYPYLTSVNNQVNNLYIFDIKPYVGTEEYQQIKDDYFLSTKNNQTYGYGEGVVPTIFAIKSGKPIDGLVIFNDEVNKEGKEYKITTSYYSQERLPNLHYLDNDKSFVLTNTSLKESEVGSYQDEGGNTHYYWKNSNSLNHYSSVFNKFANQYINK